MRHGLIAEWFHGIAGRGLVTATLPAVPVAVAANIGFGGASGLSSVAVGSSESSLGSVSAPPAPRRGIESLSATAISPVGGAPLGTEATDGSGSATSRGGSGSSFVGSTAPGGSGSSGESGGSSGAGAAPVQQPTGGTDTGIGVGAPADPGAGQGLLNQLLQGLQLGQ